MRPEDILFWLKAVPFKPFRICLNSGRTYEIRHPEMLKVSRTTMLIFSFAGEPQDPHREDGNGRPCPGRTHRADRGSGSRLRILVRAHERIDRAARQSHRAASFSPRKLRITLRIRARTFL